MPNSVNCRCGTSSRTSGLPLIRRYGIAVNSAIRAQPTTPAPRKKRPGESFGRIQRRVPSSLSVGSTRSAAGGAGPRASVIRSHLRHCRRLAGAARPCAFTPCGGFGFGGLVPCSVPRRRRARGSRPGEAAPSTAIIPLSGTPSVMVWWISRRLAAVKPVVVGEVGPDDALAARARGRRRSAARRAPSPSAIRSGFAGEARRSSRDADRPGVGRARPGARTPPASRASYCCDRPSRRGPAGSRAGTRARRGSSPRKGTATSRAAGCRTPGSRRTRARRAGPLTHAVDLSRARGASRGCSRARSKAARFRRMNV